MLEQTEGVILVITCARYLKSRVVDNPYRLKGDTIEGWKIIYVLGDPSMNEDYLLKYNKNADINMLFIKCEDDYIHLFKKIAISQEAIHKIYNIKKGVIKCDDDILFNKKLLRQYITSPLNIDFSAKRYDNEWFKEPGPEHCCGSKFDNSILEYFHKNQEHLKLLQSKIPNYDPKTYTRFPTVPEGYGGAGGVYFLSTKASKTIVDYFKKCDRDSFHKDPVSNSYPFIAEDVGTSFILCKSKIKFVPNEHLFSHISWRVNKDPYNAIGFHTFLQGKPMLVNNNNELIIQPEIVKLISD